MVAYVARHALLISGDRTAPRHRPAPPSWPRGPFKGNITEYKTMFSNFHSLCFPIFSTLELKNMDFEPQNRILREISALGPAPKVWKPMSRSLYGTRQKFRKLIGAV